LPIRLRKMNRIILEFESSDKDAEIIANATPPDGVKFSKPVFRVEASGLSGCVVTQIVIGFGIQVSATVVAMCVYDLIKKCGKKSADINGQQTILQKRNIIGLIKKVLAKQKAHDPQRRRDKNKSAKKRS